MYIIINIEIRLSTKYYLNCVSNISIYNILAVIVTLKKEGIRYPIKLFK